MADKFSKHCRARDATCILYAICSKVSKHCRASDARCMLYAICSKVSTVNRADAILRLPWKDFGVTCVYSAAILGYGSIILEALWEVLQEN